MSVRWGLSPLDRCYHAIDETAEHPRDVYRAECGHILLSRTSLCEVPGASRVMRAPRCSSSAPLGGVMNHPWLVGVLVLLVIGFALGWIACRHDNGAYPEARERYWRRQLDGALVERDALVQEQANREALLWAEADRQAMSRSTAPSTVVNVIAPHPGWVPRPVAAVDLDALTATRVIEP